MMSKDRRCAVLAILVALPLAAATGSAGASDAPFKATVDVGVGIDHTMHARNRVVRSRVGAVDAIDLLNRPVAQPLPMRNPPQGPAPSPIGGLRGLLVQGVLDSATLLLPWGPSDGRATTARPKGRPMPYIRFGEGEQVFGLSFKIQPPPQAPELPSPRS